MSNLQLLFKSKSSKFIYKKGSCVKIYTKFCCCLFKMNNDARKLHIFHHQYFKIHQKDLFVEQTLQIGWLTVIMSL